MSVGTISPENCPRDPAELLKLRPSVRFRLMNQMGAFQSQPDKVAYSSATHEEQVQRLSAQLTNVAFNGEPAAVPGTQPAAAAPAQPAAPQMAAPAAVAPAQPTMTTTQPQMSTPQQPQLSVPAAPAAVAAAPAAPAAPTAGGPTAPTMGISMPGAPGMAPRQSVQVTTPAAPAAAPAAVVAAPASEERDPGFQQDDDPLATIIQNQQNMASSLQSIAGSMQHLVSAIDQIKAQASGNNSMSGVSLLLLATFVEAAMQRSREDLASELQAGVTGGELEQLLGAVLGGAQG